jgi:hypothetical protein
MPYVELLPIPQDSEGLIAYLQTNFRRIQDALARTVGTYDNDDIEISVSSRGLILTAPNGNRYRVSVGNTGILTTTLI